jgi:hypothetical protein
LEPTRFPEIDENEAMKVEIDAEGDEEQVFDADSDKSEQVLRDEILGQTRLEF